MPDSNDLASAFVRLSPVNQLGKDFPLPDLGVARHTVAGE